MSDSQVTVSVRRLSRKQANLEASIDDAGYIVVVSPAPGTFAIDPERDLPEFLNIFTLLGQLATKKRRERHQT